MKAELGNGWTKEINENQRLDISLYPRKYTTLINMDLWEQENPTALSHSRSILLNFDKFLPLSIAEILAKYYLNKQSMKTAGIKII